MAKKRKGRKPTKIPQPIPRFEMPKPPAIDPDAPEHIHIIRGRGNFASYIPGEGDYYARLYLAYFASNKWQKLSPWACKLLGNLLAHCWFGKTTCNPSNKRLIAMTQCGKTRFHQAKDELVKAGLIAIDSGEGTRKSSVYTIQIPQVTKEQGDAFRAAMAETAQDNDENSGGSPERTSDNLTGPLGRTSHDSSGALERTNSGLGGALERTQFAAANHAGALERTQIETTEGSSSEAVVLLEMEGFGREEAEKLVASSSPQHVQDMIDNADYLEPRNGIKKSRKGYLLSAIRDRYALEQGVKEKRRRASSQHVVTNEIAERQASILKERERRARIRAIKPDELRAFKVQLKQIHNTPRMHARIDEMTVDAPWMMAQLEQLLPQD